MASCCIPGDVWLSVNHCSKDGGGFFASAHLSCGFKGQISLHGGDPQDSNICVCVQWQSHSILAPRYQRPNLVLSWRAETKWRCYSSMIEWLKHHNGKGPVEVAQHCRRWPSAHNTPALSPTNPGTTSPTRQWWSGEAVGRLCQDQPPFLWSRGRGGSIYSGGLSGRSVVIYILTTSAMCMREINQLIVRKYDCLIQAASGGGSLTQHVHILYT